MSDDRRTGGLVRRIGNAPARSLLLLLLSFAPAPLCAQTPSPTSRPSRKRLEDIRAERDRLRRDQDRLESQVRNTGAELRNIERQREVTNELVNELERQMRGLGDQLGSSSQQLALAQDNLADRRAVLERRLVDIYKRGPLHTFQVLLTAETFGDLLTRYKYLYLQNRQDRSLVEDIQRLEIRIGSAAASWSASRKTWTAGAKSAPASSGVIRPWPRSTRRAWDGSGSRVRPGSSG
jgi:septal ring factor EnvC (AmiA/AmiB activator)